jgi:hypothetical protein
MRRLLLAVLLCVSGSALAQEDPEPSPECRRLRARAESRAHLLLFPSVTVSGVHLPDEGDVGGMGLFQGTGYQLRASLSYPLLDVVRGLWVLDTASSQCAQQSARAEVQRILRQGPDVGRREALEAERAYLETVAPRVVEILEEAEQRLEAQRTTRPQWLALRLRAQAIDRLRQRVEAELRRLGAEEPADPRRLRTELAVYEEASLQLARRESSIRRSQAWRLGVRAGIIPQEQVDWFGAVDLTYDFGGIAQTLAEDAAMNAFADELRHGADELRAQVERFEERLLRERESLREGLALLEAQLALVDEQRELLAAVAERSGAAQQSMATLALQRLELEAEHRMQARRLEVLDALP